VSCWLSGRRMQGYVEVNHILQGGPVRTTLRGPPRTQGVVQPIRLGRGLRIFRLVTGRHAGREDRCPPVT
jgi:hypothetical protein